MAPAFLDSPRIASDSGNDETIQQKLLATDLQAPLRSYAYIREGTIESIPTMLMIALMSYVIGSIPFGVLLARAFRLPDPRTIGSGNIGATNMLRTGNKKIALLTLLLDAGKGAAAVLLTYHFFSHVIFDVARAALDGCGEQPTLQNCGMATIDPLLPAIALAAAALGHMLSLWLKFSGGKGVATILGGALAFSWPIGACACVLWLITYVFFRYVSLASVIMLALLPLVVGLRSDWESAGVVAIACAVAMFKHRGNIVRLLHGQEQKIHLRRQPA